MLGQSVEDPLGVEEGGTQEGLGLLPIKTSLAGEKKTEQYKGKFGMNSGVFGSLCDMEVKGYEIHMGETVETEDKLTSYSKDNIYGTYIHGVFDEVDIVKGIISKLADNKGLSIDLSRIKSRGEVKEKEYDKLADLLRENLDMNMVYSILKEANLDWKN